MLWLDIGNSRMKWLFGNGNQEYAGVYPYQQAADLRLAPIWESVPKGVAVWVASVGNPLVRAEIESIASEKLETSVNWACSETQRNGLHNSYQQVQRMGVDRWLAMLAAWEETRGACLVIDAGSAITVDLVDADGKHQGGHIVPGLHLMSRALFSGTANVKFSSVEWGEILPGQSTDEAVHRGLFAMVIGYLEFVAKHWPKLAGAKIFLTGGDALRLQQALSYHTTWRPNLVIDGLKIFAKGV